MDLWLTLLYFSLACAPGPTPQAGMEVSLGWLPRFLGEAHERQEWSQSEAVTLLPCHILLTERFPQAVPMQGNVHFDFPVEVHVKGRVEWFFHLQPTKFSYKPHPCTRLRRCCWSLCTHSSPQRCCFLCLSRYDSAT